MGGGKKEERGGKSKEGAGLEEGRERSKEEGIGKYSEWKLN